VSTPTGRLPRAAVATLVAHQRRVEAGPAAEAAAARLADDGVVVVATGQQPGLLGGPLLALHKAAGAIARARRLAQELGHPVVPVFWVASEDHDVAEIDRATVIDAGGRPAVLSAGLPADRRSVCDVPLGTAAVETVLGALRTALPATDRGAQALALSTPPAGTDVGAWFATILARILGDTGLVFVEPRDLAPWAGATYASLVTRADEIEAAVRAEGAARRGRGEAAPLERESGLAPLFLRDGLGGPRRRVSFAGDAVRLRGEPAPLDRAGLAALVAREPALAGGDVVGRVFVQNALLPVVELVAGPTELAYLAQVGAGARAVGAAFPALLPRPSAVWIDARGAEALEAFGLDASAVAEGHTGPPPPAANDGDPVVASLVALAEDVLARRAQIETVADPDGSVVSVGRALGRVHDDVERLLRDRRRALEDLAGRGLARYERLLGYLRPGGEPQERVLSPISLVARHGVEAVRGALAGLEPGTSRLLRL
jgi:bacillithiol biosynthesis cysteine-adding enzyme BshC